MSVMLDFLLLPIIRWATNSTEYAEPEPIEPNEHEDEEPEWMSRVINKHGHRMSNKKWRQRMRLMKKLSEAAALQRATKASRDAKKIPENHNVEERNNNEHVSPIIGDAACHSTVDEPGFKQQECSRELEQCRIKEAEEWLETYSTQMKLSPKDATHLRQIWNQVSYFLVAVIAFVELVWALLVRKSEDYTTQIGLILSIITVNKIVQEGGVSAVEKADANFKYHRPQANDSSKVIGDQCGSGCVPSDDDDDDEYIVFEPEIQPPLFDPSIHNQYLREAITLDE